MSRLESGLFSMGMINVQSSTQLYICEGVRWTSFVKECRDIMCEGVSGHIRERVFLYMAMLRYRYISLLLLQICYKFCIALLLLSIE